MGKGNVCTFRPYEHVAYIDYDNVHVYTNSEGEEKLLGEMSYEELTSGKWTFEPSLTWDTFEETIENFKEEFLAAYTSFYSLQSPKWEGEKEVILESKDFKICIQENDWSAAILLLQNGDEDNGRQKKNHESYFRKIEELLLTYYPFIGTYRGAWTSGQLTAAEFFANNKKNSKSKKGKI